MRLKQRIDTDIKEAMKAKDADALRALRGIKSLILLEETKEGAGDGLNTDQETKLLTRAAKQRRESAEIYKTQNREDLLQSELAELAIIERYLPQQLSAEELETRLQAIIAEVGAAGPQDMGKVMGAANKALAGQAEGKAISEAVKRLLAK